MMRVSKITGTAVYQEWGHSWPLREPVAWYVLTEEQLSRASLWKVSLTTQPAGSWAPHKMAALCENYVIKNLKSIQAQKPDSGRTLKRCVFWGRFTWTKFMSLMNTIQRPFYPLRWPSRFCLSALLYIIFLS